MKNNIPTFKPLSKDTYSYIVFARFVSIRKCFMV